ncbi:MAG: c-type cytochrome [Verrucomicrobia bacterium]|nr:c-type cytochrome [Verrucomicrobiota bacterium]
MIALARMGRTEQHVAMSVAVPEEPKQPAPGKKGAQPKKPAGGSSSPGVGPTNLADGKLQARILAALDKLEFNSLSLDLQLQLVRAYQLAFTRLGKPDAAACAKTAAHLDPLYPAKDALLNRELCQLLIFLDSKSVAAKTLGLMATARDDDESLATDALLERNTQYGRAALDTHQSRPNRQQMAYMFSLRNCTAGWTPELRQTYFSWFPRTSSWKGGNSFKGFIENTRKEALANFAPKDELAQLDAISSKVENVIPANITPPKGPGRAYTTDDVVKIAQGGLQGRDFASGKNLFSAVMCAACHNFAGSGGSIGPDITGAGNRYTIRDLVENLTEPSKVISDQYGSHQIEKTDGSIVVGRIISEEGGKVNVMTNPFAPNFTVPIDARQIKSKKDYPVSMMPPGLINSLNENELKDLLAFLLSGGNEKDKMFSK